MAQTSPRETLDRNIQQLKDDILVLGSMVEQALLKSVDALKRQDFELLADEILGFIGNVVGSLAVEVIGNKKAIDKLSVQKYLVSLMK